MANGREIFVTFEGKRRRLVSLAKEHGVSAQTAYYRYRKAGSPETVNKTLFAQANEYLKVRLLPDGTMHTPSSLANMFGVNDATIHAKLAKGKVEWTRQELDEWGARIAKHRMAEAKKKAEESPSYQKPMSLMERAMLRF